jgi:hypothetical protein
MSQIKSVEAQLKEAIEASKQTIALTEQVTALASEKETLSKRLAEIESSLSAPKAETPMATDPLIIAKLGELLAERDAQAKAIKALSEKTEQVMAYASKLEKEAAKKADLNKYVERQREEGEEGETPAEKINDSGKGGPQYPKGKKAKKADESESEGEGDEAPMMEEGETEAKAKKAKAAMPDFIKKKIEEKEETEADDEYGVHSKAKAKKSAPMVDEEAEDEACGPEWDKKMGKKAKKVATKASMDDEDEGDDIGDLDQAELNMIRRHRLEAKGKKADSKLSNPTEEDSKNFNKEFEQPGLDPAKNNVSKENTTSPSVKLAAKAKSKAETDVEEIIESPDQQMKEDSEGGEEKEVHEKTLTKPEKGAKAQASKTEAKEEIPQVVLDYIKQLMEKEKQAANSLPGMNKTDVVGQPDQDEEESFLKKKEGKKAEEAPIAPVAETPKTLDAVIEVAVQKFAEANKAKKQAEADLASVNQKLAAEVTAKTEATEAVALLHKKFEALMAKVTQIEGTDRSLEAKAAKIVAGSASDAVATGHEGSDVAPKTDAEFLAQFESIKDKREQNKFFNAHRTQIERAAMTNLKRRS